MSDSLFPPLPLAEWRETRDTLHAYAQLLGKIRGALTPRQPHWWHVSLHPTERGLTTTPMPIPDSDDTIEIVLDLTRHAVEVARGPYGRTIPLAGHSVPRLKEEVLEALNKRGVQPQIDPSLFADATPRLYDGPAAERYLQALLAVTDVLRRFQAELPGETSPVQLWPHHFDLSLVWFSGRKVPGTDPADEENADEQMAFGFSTGDEGIPDPYFYITAYPWPEALPEAELPPPARWHLADWQGGFVFYNELARGDDAADRLLAILQTVWRAGAALMQDR